MRVQSIRLSIAFSLACRCRLRAVFTRSGRRRYCLFWGFDNMPPFSHLRSDYPLNLTLLERPYACALKQSYRAGLPSARAIPVSLIGSNWWFLSRPLVDRAFDAQHYSGTIGRHFIG
jgi:hypothetical protein